MLGARFPAVVCCSSCHPCCTRPLSLELQDSQRLVANMTGGLPATAAGLNRLARLKEGQAQTLLASNAKQFAVLAPAGGAVPGQAAALQGAAYNVRAASEQQRQQDQAGEAAEQPGEAAATAGVAIIAGGGVAGLYRGTKGKPRDRSVQGAPEGQVGRGVGSKQQGGMACNWIGRGGGERLRRAVVLSLFPQRNCVL